MAEMPEAYIYDAIRTPRGRGKASGSLYEVKPVSLVVGLIHELRARYPAVKVDEDPIYIRDGNVWTSAGVTAGMDLAMALVAEDHGHAVARDVIVNASGEDEEFRMPITQTWVRGDTGWVCLAGHAGPRLTD